MTMLGQIPTGTTETSQGTESGPFFYDLMPHIGEVLNQADKLQGQNVSERAVVKPLEFEVKKLDAFFDVNPPRTVRGILGITGYANLALVASGRLRLPQQYVASSREEASQLTQLDVPTTAITALKVNPGLQGGPRFHEILADARKALATDPRYIRSHPNGGTCGEMHCSCHLAAIDPSKVMVDSSPILDMRIQSDGDPTIITYSVGGEMVEEPSPDISRLIEFQQMLLSFQSIQRKVFIPPKNTEPENDAEHSYSLAMVVWFLAQYFPEINSDKAIRLAMAHDLVELHAGDTFSYGTKKELSSKKAREATALKKLQKEWPDFPALFRDITEYEAGETKEAKFVYALDKLVPGIMNYLGKGEIWQRFKITKAQFRQEKESKISASSEVYPYYEELLDLLHQHSHYFHSEKTS